MSSTIKFGCSECKDLGSLGIPFTMAFQPFVDIKNKNIYGYEALVRGPNNEPASFILNQLNDANRYKFDQSIRVKAIELATELNLEGILSINFLPNAVYKPETCIRATLEAAKRLNFDTSRIMFEVTEGEKIVDHNHLANIFIEYRKHNFITAIDDFGAGYSGLNLLADWQPNIIKLDMALTRNIHQDKVRQSLVKGILTVCEDLSIGVIAEGVETIEECRFLISKGVNLFQGYYFARPGFESLPTVSKELLDNL